MQAHAQSVSQIEKELKTNLNSGISPDEAQQRLTQVGANRLPAPKPLSTTAIFFDQFKSPLIIILLCAAAISLVFSEFIDAGVILMAVFINTLVGFIQETKASDAMERLQEMVEHKAKVLRDGQEIEIDASQIVPGDILFLEAGDQIAADARLFESHSLSAIEASLTGESIPSYKKEEILHKGIVISDQENMVFAGTNIASGKGKAIVTATGAYTELGKIATLVKETEQEETPLQKRLSDLGKILGITISIICFALLWLGVLQGRPFFEVFLTSVAVAVAAIPEGLPVAVTVILTIGMQKILQKKALTRKLLAAETLGSVTTICSDKTATLTTGKMQVAHVLTCSGTDKFMLDGKGNHLLTLKIGLLCNNAFIENPKEELANWVVHGDSTDKAMLLAATQAGLEKQKLNKEMPRLDELPFDHEKKYMATLHKMQNAKYQISNGEIVYVKGAPEKLLEISKFVDIDGQQETLTPSRLKEIEEGYEKLTTKGLRVLAVGYKKIQNSKFKIQNSIVTNLTFVGLIGLKDPLRPEAKEMIEKAKKAGIRPVIVTGDHRLTAKAIAAEIGLRTGAENIYEGEELERLTDEELEKVIGKIDVFARVEPKHKLRIIDILKKKGEVVAVVGDGVNDAPAIKKADVGIALGSGTDVAKETADIILLDDNFKTIISAIEQGRTIFENIKKVVLYLLSDSFTEVILIGGSLLFGLPLPLLPAQILWVNLIEDTFPSLALSFEPMEKEIMDAPPRPRNEPILDTEMKVLIFIIGVLIDLVLFSLFWFLLRAGYDLGFIRTVIFAGLAIDTLFIVFSCRSLRHLIWQKNPFTNPYLLGSVLISAVLLVTAIYLRPLQIILRTQSLSFWPWVLIIGLGLLKTFAIEVTKWVFIVRAQRR